MSSDDQSIQSHDEDSELPKPLRTREKLKESAFAWMAVARPELAGRRIAFLFSEHPEEEARKYAASLADVADRDSLKVVRSSFKASEELFSIVVGEDESIKTVEDLDDADLPNGEEEILDILRKRGDRLRRMAASWPLVSELEETLHRLRAAESAAEALWLDVELTEGEAQMVEYVHSRLSGGEADAVESVIGLYDLLMKAADDPDSY